MLNATIACDNIHMSYEWPKQNKNLVLGANCLVKWDQEGVTLVVQLPFKPMKDPITCMGY